MNNHESADVNVHRFHNVYVNGVDDIDLRRFYHNIIHRLVDHSPVDYEDCGRCARIRIIRRHLNPGAS
jgi:hypothetical protein